MVPTTTHAAYTADCHKRAVDSITDTLPFLRKAEESGQTRESMTSRDQLVESGNVWQALKSNRPSESTYTWGVTKDGTVGAIEKIPTVLRDSQEISQQDWRARSYERLTESTSGWHHALREAGMRERLAEQSNRCPDWHTEQPNRHPDWRAGYHDIYQQQVSIHMYQNFFWYTRLALVHFFRENLTSTQGLNFSGRQGCSLVPFFSGKIGLCFSGRQGCSLVHFFSCKICKIFQVHKALYTFHKAYIIAF